MFKNVGEKIKLIAMVFFIIVVALVVYFVIDPPENVDSTYIVIVAVSGILSAWVSSLLIYGFGELIVKTTQIEENTRSNKEKTENN